MLRGIALAESLRRLFPPMDAVDRRLSLAIYRRLAEGAPVAPAGLCQALDLDVEDAGRRLSGWPGVYYDDQGRIIGFWGLTIRRMQHRLRMHGRELFAWCAWDTLFIPELLGASAEVASACRGSGTAICLRVGPHAVEWSAPDGICVSFVVPEEEALRADVITGFCHYVHFFSSEAAAGPWLDKHAHAILLSLAEAFEVGRVLNSRRYPQ